MEYTKPVKVPKIKKKAESQNEKKYLMKQIAMYFRDRGEPNQFDDLELVEDLINSFLRKHGRLVTESIRNLPYIKEGIITKPVRYSSYVLRDPEDKKEKYLVFQIKEPYGLFLETGTKYSLVVVGPKRDEGKIDSLLGRLKIGSEWKEEKEEILEASGLENIEKLLAPASN